MLEASDSRDRIHQGHQRRRRAYMNTLRLSLELTTKEYIDVYLRIIRYYNSHGCHERVSIS